MNIQPIKSNDELRVALLRVDEIWGAEKGTPDGDELEVLVTLISDYEDGQIIKDRSNLPEVKIHINDL